MKRTPASWISFPESWPRRTHTSTASSDTIESAEVIEGGDTVTVEVEGQYSGSSDPARPFCGDQIDMRVTVGLPRVAGCVAFANPHISARGEVNDDWVDPELRYGSEAA